MYGRIVTVQHTILSTTARYPPGAKLVGFLLWKRVFPHSQNTTGALPTGAPVTSNTDELCTVDGLQCQVYRRQSAIRFKHCIIPLTIKRRIHTSKYKILFSYWTGVLEWHCAYLMTPDMLLISERETWYQPGVKVTGWFSFAHFARTRVSTFPLIRKYQRG
jgi:hypothetical protein